MSFTGGFRSIYDDVKNLCLKGGSHATTSNLQSMPNIASGHMNPNIRRTLSRDRSSMWREARCCCQQKITESERLRRRIQAENAELRRLCIYLDEQRQQALNELNQWKNSRQNNGSCWYSDPCCSSNCEFRCPANNASNLESSGKPDSPPGSHLPPNEELLAYIQSLEERIMTLEEGRTTIHRDGVLLGKTRRPIRSVSQQPSPMSTSASTTTRDYTLQAQQLSALESSQSTTLTGTTYYSSELDDEEDVEEDNSGATTVYIASKRASLSHNENAGKPPPKPDEGKSAVGIVRKFISTRESLLQALKKRNELFTGQTCADLGYAVIQHRSARQPPKVIGARTEASSMELPPEMPELIMKRKFTAENPMNHGRQLARQVA